MCSYFDKIQKVSDRLVLVRYENRKLESLRVAVDVIITN